MDILLGVFLSIATEAYKKLTARFGVTVTKDTIFVMLFAATIGWTILIKQGVISMATVQYAVTILSSSIATYELIIKRIQTWMQNRKISQ